MTEQTAARPAAASPGADGPERPRLRRDVEGLRAVAIGLVLAYHLAGGPSGAFVGVDVFFVVSGFVITTQIVREVERTGRLSLPRFYARRARRLLPAAGLVLLVTTAAAWWLAPRSERAVVGGDVAGAAGYVVNWVFSARSVDYLAEDLGPSPVLHFWSLSVEEQFYLVWPLVVVALVAATARRGRPVSRTSLAAGLAATVVVPSLVFSAVYTVLAPERAFFLTPARLWEMGVGALVALGATRWSSLDRRVAAALGWAGLAVLGVSVVILDGSTGWPGTAALAPTTATAAVLVAGFRAGGLGPERLLGVGPAVWVGGLSYSLYLWHWPLFRFLEWREVPLDAGVRVGVLAATVVLAWLSLHLVENPVRHGVLAGRTRASLVAGAVVTALGVVAGLALVVDARREAAARGERTAAPLPPAVLEVPTELTGPGAAPLYDRLTPTPAGAPLDLDPHACESELTSEEVSECVVGDLDGTVDVVLAGDSKMGQWTSVVGAVGSTRGWRVRALTKSGCPFVDPAARVRGTNATCRAWRTEVLSRLTATPPDVLVTTSVADAVVGASGRGSSAPYREALARTWAGLTARGTLVVAVSDTPGPPRALRPVYECVARRGADPDSCSWPWQRTRASTALRRAAADVEGAVFADLDPWVCPGGTCRAVHRNVLTYRQGSHVTATYAATLVGPVEALVGDALRRAAAETGAIPPGTR